MSWANNAENKGELDRDHSRRKKEQFEASAKEADDQAFRACCGVDHFKQRRIQTENGLPE